MAVTMITVGYGDIIPVNANEMILCVITMLIACGVLAYALNQVGTIIQDIYSNEKEVKHSLYIINKYMSKKNIN